MIHADGMTVPQGMSAPQRIISFLRNYCNMDVKIVEAGARISAPPPAPHLLISSQGSSSGSSPSSSHICTETTVLNHTETGGGQGGGRDGGGMMWTGRAAAGVDIAADGTRAGAGRAPQLTLISLLFPYKVVGSYIYFF